MKPRAPSHAADYTRPQTGARHCRCMVVTALSSVYSNDAFIHCGSVVDNLLSLQSGNKNEMMRPVLWLMAQTMCCYSIAMLQVHTNNLLHSR